jgi:sulfatase modifying factor 1
MNPCACVVLAAVLGIGLGASATHADPVLYTPLLKARAVESVRVPAGSFVPLYGQRGSKIAVKAFAMDATAVTNGQYLEFVRAARRWRRSRVTALFAERDYLAHWQGDLVLGPEAAESAPVTNVSWFAARRYCRALGKRLPMVDEWEYLARASETASDGSRELQFTNRILSWYSSPTKFPLPTIRSTYRNYWRVWDMHGLIWEWTEDFNSILMTGESRKDGSLDRQLYCAGGALGAIDPKDYATFMRYATRASVKAKHNMKNMGFRCVH